MKQCYHNNKRVKRCKDCPHFLVDSSKREAFDKRGRARKIVFVETFCTPVKPKHGFNPVGGNTIAGTKDYCRLTNEVTMDFVFDFGKFAGKTLAEAQIEAPKYIRFLVENDIIKIVRN